MISNHMIYFLQMHGTRKILAHGQSYYKVLLTGILNLRFVLHKFD